MAEPVRARRLTEDEGCTLLRIMRRGKHESVRVRRATIIMASAAGSPVASIARLIMAHEDTVRDVIHAFNRTHGIRYFHGCYSLGDDRLWGVMRRRKGGDHSLAALRSIRAAKPDGAPIHVIMDNLSANKTPKIRAWAKRNNVELCLTPTNASWANPIEAQFGPLRTFTMSNSDHPNHIVLARRTQAYLR